MNVNMPYNSALTAEQFLYHEMQISCKLYLKGVSVVDAIAQIKEGNLFQYPTERKVSKLTRACYRRIEALHNQALVKELAFAPADIAKQINLYAMMCYNRLMWEFMVSVIGKKFRNQDFTFSRKDLNMFFTRLQAQHDDIASWSEGTVTKLKQVMTKALVEAEYLDSVKSEVLNPVFISEELLEGIRETGDDSALIAFNCFM